MRWIIGLPIALALLVATACSSATPAALPVSSTTVPGSSATAAPTATGAAGLEPEPPAIPHELAFTATLIGGESLDGASLAGRDVLFWFWTPG